MKKVLGIGIAVSILVLSLCYAFRDAPEAVETSDAVVALVPADVCGNGETLDAIVKRNGYKASQMSLQITKSKYLLEVMVDGQCIKSYPVVLGGNPIDDKLKEGDSCTPEGTFKVYSKYPHNKWNKFIWIDYPTDDSWKKHKAAKASGKIPSDSKIGGEIGIHGVPEGADYAIAERQNWTLGCVSLTNSDVDEIYPYLREGTSILILH